MAEANPGAEGTRRLAVVGHPIAHSRSPAMQNAALADLGLAGEWEYSAIDIEPEEFESGIRKLAGSGFVGVNVTVPHKEAALGLSRSASTTATEIGAANALTFGPDGISAENYDGPALAEFLPEGLGGEGALVLGAGGAARAAIWALTGSGADVSIWNRTPSRAEGLATSTGIEVDPEPQLDRFAVVVNASAAGLGGGDPFADLPLGPEDFREGQLLIEMVYGDGPGALVEAARAAGAEAVDGISVLVAQGALSLEAWTGRTPSRQVMDEAARAA